MWSKKELIDKRSEFWAVLARGATLQAASDERLTLLVLQHARSRLGSACATPRSFFQTGIMGASSSARTPGTPGVRMNSYTASPCRSASISCWVRTPRSAPSVAWVSSTMNGTSYSATFRIRRPDRRTPRAPAPPLTPPRPTNASGTSCLEHGTRSSTSRCTADDDEPGPLSPRPRRS